MITRRLRAITTAFVLFALPQVFAASAQAQCTKDTDCKGNRVCNQGACVDPTPTTAPQPMLPQQPAPPLVSQQPAPPPVTAPAPDSSQATPAYAPAYGAPPYQPAPGYPPAYALPPGYAPAPAPPAYVAPPPYPTTAPAHTSPGWASGAATYGIIASAISFGLAAGAEATKDKTLPSGPLGGVATVLFGISLPIVAAGGASARENPLVTGYSGLRITGWIGYAVTLADAAVLLSQVGKHEPPDGQILSVGILGVSSLVCFIVDAYASAGEANRIAEFERRRASSRRSPGVVVPFVSRDPVNPQRTAGGLAWLTAF